MLPFPDLKRRNKGEDERIEPKCHGPAAEDLTGRRFGRLIAVSRAASWKNGARWECVCTCGNTVTVRAASLKSGKTRSCGCLARSLARERCRLMGRARKGLRNAGAGRPHIDIRGQRFGRWTVIGLGRKHKSRVNWLCLCDCGTRRQVNGTELRRGRSKSCGCLSRELSRDRMIAKNNA